VSTLVKDALDEARETEIRIAFQDDLGAQKGVALVDRDMRVEDLQRDAMLFGLADDEYGLYHVVSDHEAIRLDPRQSVGDALGDRREATLRFAPELRGAVQEPTAKR
jgi:hypothetical protein